MHKSVAGPYAGWLGGRQNHQKLKPLSSPYFAFSSFPMHNNLTVVARYIRIIVRWTLTWIFCRNHFKALHKQIPTEQETSFREKGGSPPQRATHSSITSRIMYIPRSIPALTLTLSLLTSSTLANPLPSDSSPIIENTLVQRCAYPCGWAGLCCQTAGACYTDSANQAQCGSGSGSSVGLGGAQYVASGSGQQGQYQVFTTTYTEIDAVLRTSTGSYLLGAASATQQVQVASTAAAGSSGYLTCDTSIGESPCGSICCAVGQKCQYQGQCVAAQQNNDFSSSYLASVTALASGTPAIRPTSNAVATVTSTGTPTFTTAFSTPMPTSGGSTSGMSGSTTTNSGLSPGAIAGIVIGVLLGIALLLLICGCLCFKGLLDSFLAFFGIGPKRRGRRTETDVYEEEYYEGSRPPPRRWFGAGPARPKKSKDRKSSGGGLLGVAGGLAALAVLLGIKRKRDARKNHQDKSSYSGSSYTYSDYTSESESS